MNKYIQKLIIEQFNIGNMNLNSKPKNKYNIFNKNIIDPYKVYDSLLKLKSKSVTAQESEELDYYVKCLNDCVAVVKPQNIDSLRTLVLCYSYIYPNDSLNWLDVSEFTNMKSLFKRTKYNGDISQWDVSNVTNMFSMFEHSSFNNDISCWDVSNVENMAFMFKGSKFNGDISGWDVSNVTTMAAMFAATQFDTDISGWNVSNVTDMTYMFHYSVFNHDISNWDVSNVQNMQQMFFRSKFNHDISMWDVDKVTCHKCIFDYCDIKEEYKPKFK